MSSSFSRLEEPREESVQKMSLENLPDFMRQLPIRLRLTLWYVLLMAVSFFGLGFFLFSRFQASLMNTLDATLQISVSQTLSTFEARTVLLPGNPPRLEQPAESTAEGFAIRVISEDGILWDAYGDDEVLWGEAPYGFSTQANAIDEAWRILSQPLTDSTGQVIGWIQAAQTIENVSRTVDDLQTQLFLGIPLVLLLAGIGGYFLAGRALRPVDKITRTAQTIEAGGLSRRIAYDGPHDEIGRLARTFDQMLERLDTAFARERRFTGDAAHELRTPLTALKGQIEVALNQPRSQGEYETRLRGLSGQVERLIRLSNALLFLSRSDQGRLSWEPGILNLADLLHAVCDQIEPLADEKGLKFERHIPAPLAGFGDTDHLIRLFLNLLDNAIKYTPAGGQIILRAYQEQAGVQITIHNSGLGISSEHLPHVFERFYRIDADRSSQSGGTGLGLAIAREIVHIHGGQIRVASQPDQGTTFAVDLPIAEDAVPRGL